MKSFNKIVMMEDHDKAYYVWRELGIKDKILVHIDAHIDFSLMPDMDLKEILDITDSNKLSHILKHQPIWNPFIRERNKMVNIGNYIFPALKEGIIKSFYWVVPDPTWESKKGLKYIKKTIQQLLKIKRYVDKDLEINKDYLYCRIFNKDIFIYSLSNLSQIDEPILLDIDLDFLLTQFIWDGTNPNRTPWIFPEVLIEKLYSKLTVIDILTIAYSVEGGFTPLKYKYLGDELHLLFEGNLNEQMKNMMQCKRKAIEYEKKAQIKECINCFENALKLKDNDASVYYNLAVLYLNNGNTNLANIFFKEAVRLDSSYKTPYNNEGIIYEESGRLKQSKYAYKKFLELDNKNIYVLNGLGRISLEEKKFNEAEQYFKQSLQIGQDSIDTLLGLGIVYFKINRLKNAEDLFLRANTINPDEQITYLWLGRLFEKNKEIDKAIEFYKQAVMLGFISFHIHFRLFLLYLKKNFYYCAWQEMKRTIKIFIGSHRLGVPTILGRVLFILK